MIQWILMLLGWLLADLLWWRLADKRLRRMSAATGWRFALAAFVLFQVAYMLMVIIGSFLDHVPDAQQVEIWPVVAYLWHLFLMPLSLLGYLMAWTIRRLRARHHEKSVLAPEPAPTLSRRQMLSAIGISLPPLISTGVGAIAVSRLGEFRTRAIDLKLPTLPPDLDGLTIAHVSDLHIGRFLPEGTLERVAQATNALAADLVVFTGDLLDASCESPKLGLKFLHSLDPRHGLAICEGNHDGMHGSDVFEDLLKSAGLPLLLDESTTFRVPGRRTAVQMLGVTWGELLTGKETGHVGKAAKLMYREPTPGWMEDAVKRVASQRQPDAFPILLAHHPHALDPAAAHDFPLILSGHTHGGQLMLTQNIGAGPIRFKYWAGEYHRANSKLFVNNGVGNWFPLRVNAPAEIVKLTLRRA